jgi:hypothetical protein
MDASQCRQQVENLHPLPDPARRPNGASHADTVQRLKGQHTFISPIITTKAICTAIKNSPRESATGGEGLRFEHFHAMLALSKTSGAPAAAAQAALDAFTGFVNLAAAGDLPPWYREPFLAARLFLLQKQPGVLTPRPIAVRGVCPRIIAKALLVGLEAEIQEKLGHQQVGVAVSCGAEGIAMAMRQSLILQRHVVAWDAKNAYNSVDRHAVLEQVAAHFPDLFLWASFAYSEATPLFAVSNAEGAASDPLAHLIRFLSSEGVQQGDPLASLFFCLALKPALDELTLELAKTAAAEAAAVPPPPAPPAAMGLCTEPFVVAALMDDIDVAASPAVTIRCIECLPEILKRHCNLSVNWGKSIVHPPLPADAATRASFDAACIVAGGTPTEALAGLRVLGAPVSGPSDALPARSDLPPSFDVGFRPPVGGEDYVALYLDAAGASTAVKIAQIVEYAASANVDAQAARAFHRSKKRRGRSGSRKGHASAERPIQCIQDANLLLLHCVLPRLTYLLRVAPPSQTDHLAAWFDSSLVTAFATINGIDADELRPPVLRASTPTDELRALLLVLPTRHGGLALRSLHSLRTRAYTAGCVDAERVSVTLMGGAAAAGTAALSNFPFADQLGFTAALQDVLTQAATADAEAIERHSRLPLWKRQGADAVEVPTADATSTAILQDCASVFSREPYWATSALKLQHNISALLESATFFKALNPPVASGCSRSPEVESCCNRLAALSMKGVAAWYRTVPTAPALELHDYEFTDSVRYTLSLARVHAHLAGTRCPMGATCSLRGKPPKAVAPAPAVAPMIAAAPVIGTASAPRAAPPPGGAPPGVAPAACYRPLHCGCPPHRPHRRGPRRCPRHAHHHHACRCNDGASSPHSFNFSVISSTPVSAPDA